MWYFAWILGVGFAGTFAILNAMWFEAHVQHTSETNALETRP
jgi:cytochrome bd-I ubiquinol oxidase subunit X